MNLENEMEELEIRERDALIKCKDSLITTLDITDNKEDVKILISPPKAKTDWDCIIQTYTPDGQKDRSIIIEAKVRDTHFNDLLLEGRKYNKLIKEKIKHEKEFGFQKVELLYLCFTPKGTYLFKLTKHKERYEWIVKEYNKYTAAKEKGRVEKKVTLLDINNQFCTKLDFLYDYNIIDSRVEKKLEQQKRVKCIFEALNKGDRK